MNLVIRTACALIALTATAALSTASTIVFNEPFSAYTGSSAATEFYKNWTRLSGSGNLANTAFHASDAKISSTYLQVERNTVHQCALPSTVDGNFSLTATVSFESYGSGKQLWFGLFDANGTHGYVAHFNSQTTGGGMLRLKEFSVNAVKDITYDLAGTNLTTLASASGLTSAVTDTAKLTLNWNATDKKLSLLINDAAITGLTNISVSTSVINNFKYIVLGGATGSQFSNIQFTGTSTAPIPEPSTIAILLASLALVAGLASRRYRSR